MSGDPPRSASGDTGSPAFGPAPELPPFLAGRLPFRRRTVTLARGANAGKRLHFIDHGDPGDRPVLLQHGNPTWSFLWRRVVARLPGHRCVAPDLLGFGLSDGLDGIGEHSLERHAEALVELVEALDLGGLVLAGQDWGGPLVAALGARCPDRVAALVLANTAVLVPARPRGTAFHRLARMPLVSDLLFRVLGFPQNALRLAQADRRSISGEVARAYRWPLRGRRRSGPLALARMVPDGPGHPSVPLLRHGESWARDFDGPTVLVWGTRDPILGRALERHRRAFPRAPVLTTPAGHFIQEEAPDLVAAAIDAAGSLVSRRAG